MLRRIIICVVMMATAGFVCFGQQPASNQTAANIRDYVGLITQAFHPDVVSYMKGLQGYFQKQKHEQAAKSIDNYLKGDTGTGFVYVANDGKNYIITNFHVISNALPDGLTVTFEKQSGEKTIYSNLSIVAADEEMDIALLAFDEGENPFRQGLSFSDRTLQETDTVFSAGFPGLGTAMIWQIGQGIVSNASARLPDLDDDAKIIGPFIQHTAQVDPGNSGGPLLVQAQGVPTGFAVAGINTLSARYRQGANYSIPMDRVQSFLNASLSTANKDDAAGLETRTESFMEGLRGKKSVYHHIAKFLSNACTAENFEYAESILFSKASQDVKEDVVQEFSNSPVSGMSYAVAWLIENNLQNKSGYIVIKRDSITAVDEKTYTVDFNVNNKTVTSQWINEYGIWRVKSFGDFADASNKATGSNKGIGKSGSTQRGDSDSSLTIYPDLQITADFLMLLDRGYGFGLDLTLRDGYSGFGVRGFFAKDFFQGDLLVGLYFPIPAGKVGFTPYINIASGLQFINNVDKDGLDFFDPDREKTFIEKIQPFWSLSAQAGLQFNIAAGLYIRAAYQFNFTLDLFDYRNKYKLPKDMHVVLFGLGYSFDF